MYYEKLRISQIFSNLESSIFKLYDLVMCNLYTKFVNFLEICKKYCLRLHTGINSREEWNKILRVLKTCKIKVTSIEKMCYFNNANKLSIIPIIMFYYIKIKTCIIIFVALNNYDYICTGNFYPLI